MLILWCVPKHAVSREHTNDRIDSDTVVRGSAMQESKPLPLPTITLTPNLKSSRPCFSMFLRPPGPGPAL